MRKEAWFTGDLATACTHAKNCSAERPWAIVRIVQANANTSGYCAMPLDDALARTGVDIYPGSLRFVLPGALRTLALDIHDVMRVYVKGAQFKACAERDVLYRRQWNPDMEKE